MELIKDLGVEPVKNYRTRFALFKCPHCFDKVKRRASNGGRDKSCGCQSMSLQNKGLAKANKRLHETWVNMKTRCLNPNYHQAHRYSQRGISVSLITLNKQWVELN